MKKLPLYATFDREDSLLQAVQQLRHEGYDILDVYTPYAVHGLESAMGLPHSRLPWCAAAFGTFGALFMLWFQFWTSAVNWPLNVGGRPFQSAPAFLPVIFETAVLLAGLGIVACFFVRAGLFPGKTARPPRPDVTDDRFVVLAQIGSPNLSSDHFFDLVHSLGAIPDFLSKPTPSLQNVA